MSNKSILVVDDSPTELHLLTEPLKRRGFRVTTATNGQDALRKAALEQPDLILLDVIMPKPNGFQVCRTLKRQSTTKEIKIVYVTSKDQPTDRVWGMRQGADDYITKPFDERTLLQTVNRLI